MSGYQRINFKDQNVERPKTYDVTNNPDGSITLIDSFGNVEELGTPINSETMGHIEDALEENDKRITALENATDYDFFLNTSQITNCITETPQRIKLEAIDGVLVLKAGSEVIVPNGFEEDGVTPKFDYVTIEDDITAELGSTNNGLCVVLYDSERNKVYANVLASYCASGTTTVTTGTGYFYNTSTNILTFHNAGTYEDRLYSLPLALIQKEADVLNSVNQIFNGMGYIGATVWVDKGVKGLIPNGRNENGTLKNTEIITSKITTYSRDLTGNVPLWLKANGDLWSTAGIKYNYITNTVNATAVDNTEYPSCQIAEQNLSNGVVNTFKLKQPFRAVDYNEVKTVVDAYQNGASWYRVYSDGWCEQGGLTSSAKGTKTINLLKQYSSTTYSILMQPYYNTTSHGDVPLIETSSKTVSSFKIEDYYAYGSNWETKGYIS